MPGVLSLDHKRKLKALYPDQTLRFTNDGDVLFLKDGRWFVLMTPKQTQEWIKNNA